jgi:hypothetical protein
MRISLSFNRAFRNIDSILSSLLKMSASAACQSKTSFDVRVELLLGKHCLNNTNKSQPSHLPTRRHFSTSSWYQLHAFQNTMLVNRFSNGDLVSSGKAPLLFIQVYEQGTGAASTGKNTNLVIAT